MRVAILPALLALLTATAWGEEAAPPAPRAEVSPGPYFVGQAIDLRILVDGRGQPTAAAPRVAGADVEPAGPGRFRVVARRAGTLVIPPMTARLGGRSGKTAPLRLTIRDLPAAGRPATFLGGVGRLDVEAEARPATVRVGQALEYRVRLTGPGARGSTARPPLGGSALEALAIRVEPLPDETVADPPGRVVRYRLRPGRPGRGVLPPVAVSTFDPKSERYMTRASAGVPIRVEDVPTLNPAAVRYGDEAGGDRGSVPAWVRGAAACAGILAVPAILALVLLGHARRGADPRRVARRAARRLRADPGGADVARRITDGLVAYLAAALGRPEGALTPEEARRGIEGVTGDGTLAGRAGRLVAECDRVRYGTGGPPAEGLAGEAVAVFEALGKGGAWRGRPREAPPTAGR